METVLSCRTPTSPRKHQTRISNLLKALNPFSMPLPPVLFIQGSLAQSPGCTCFPHDDRSLQEQVRQILVLRPGTAARFPWTSHMPHRARWLRQAALAEMSELHEPSLPPSPISFFICLKQICLIIMGDFFSKNMEDSNFLFNKWNPFV